MAFRRHILSYEECLKWGEKEQAVWRAVNIHQKKAVTLESMTVNDLPDPNRVWQERRERRLAKMQARKK